MRKAIKSFCFILLLLSMVIFSFFMVSCKQENVPELENNAQLTLNQSELTIENYGTGFLRATKTNISEEIVWSSSFPNIATVDQIGRITAHSLGETIITAKAGQTSATCKVVVIETTIEPTIKTEYEQLSIKEGSTFTVSPVVTWEDIVISEEAKFSYYSYDKNIATVSSLDEGMACLISGAKVGETSIVVKAEVRGKITYKEIDVIVKREEVCFNANNPDYEFTKDGYIVDVATVSVDEHLNYTLLDFYLTYDGVKIEDYDIEWTTENDNVVELDEDGKCTSLKAGTAVVIGEYYYQPHEKTYSVKVLVNVYKPTLFLENYYFRLNKEEAVVELPTNEGTGLISVNETENEIDIKSGKVTLDTDVFIRNVDNEVFIETDMCVFKFYVSIDDYVIENKDDFIQWYREGYFKDSDPVNTRYCEGKTVILKTDLDLTGEVFNHGASTPYSQWENGLFYGVFDGQNHVISNFTSDRGFIPNVGDTGVIKNLTMLQVVNTGTTGFLGQFFLGQMSNCYFQGKQTAITESQYFTSMYSRWQITNTSKGHKASAKVVSNVVVNVERSSGETADVLGEMFAPWNAKISNVFVISNKNNGKLFNDTTWTGVANFKVYQTLEAMQAEVTTLPSGCDESLWQIKNGTLATNSAVEYFSEYCSKLLEDVKDVEELFIGVEYKLTNDTDEIEWIFGLLENAYTFNDGIIVITDDSLIGSNVEITARACSPDRTCQAEKVIQIKNIYAQPTVERLDVLLGLNKEDGVVLSVEQSGYQIAVYIDGVEIQDTFEISNGELKIDKSHFGNISTTKKAEVRLIKDGRAEYIYNMNVEIVDYAIGTKEEFAAWYRAGSIESPNPQYTNSNVALTADLDLSGVSIAPGQIYGIYFEGTFDGKGHVISNFTATYGLLPCLKGTLKNLSMVNMTVKDVNTGLLGKYLLGTLENCYFQGQHEGGAGATSRQTGLYSAYADQTSGTPTDVVDRIENVVVNVYKKEVRSETDPLFGFGLTPNSGTSLNVNISDIKNIYMVYNGASNLKGFNDALKQSPYYKDNHFYKTLDDMKAEVTAVPANFDAEQWTIYNGMLMMNGAANYYEAQSTELTVSNEETEITIGTALKLTPNMPWVSVTLKKANGEEISNTAYTFVGNMLTITDESLANETITVSISAYAGGCIATATAVEKTFTVVANAN